MLTAIRNFLVIILAIDYVLFGIDVSCQSVFLNFFGFVSQSFSCTCSCLKTILNFESMYIQLLVKGLLWELDELWQNDTSYMYCYFEHWANSERWCSTFIALNNFEERQIFLTGKKNTVQILNI